MEVKVKVPYLLTLGWWPELLQRDYQFTLCGTARTGLGRSGHLSLPEMD